MPARVVHRGVPVERLPVAPLGGWNTLRYLLFKEGPLTVGAASSGGFTTIDKDNNRPDYNFILHQLGVIK
ncbi:MAG: hypothetical protein HC803_05900 [Saprospiraceae bacterium]|nr:hypothetical protein [Saprospiraceae bacterium]